MSLKGRLFAGFGIHAPGREWYSNPHLSSQTTTNCVVLGYNVLREARPALPWRERDTLDAFMLNGTEPFANIAKAKEIGLALDVGPYPLPPGCYIAQKWRTLEPLKSGHFIILIVNKDDTMWVMESTPIRTPDQWLRKLQYQDLANYFNVPEAHVHVARLI